MSWGGNQQPAWDPHQPQQPHQQQHQQHQQHQQQYGDSQSYGQQNSSNYYQQQPQQGYQQPGYMPMHPSYPQQSAHHVQVQRRAQIQPAG